MRNRPTRALCCSTPTPPGSSRATARNVHMYDLHYPKRRCSTLARSRASGSFNSWCNSQSASRPKLGSKNTINHTSAPCPRTIKQKIHFKASVSCLHLRRSSSFLSFPPGHTLSRSRTQTERRRAQHIALCAHHLDSITQHTEFLLEQRPARRSPASQNALAARAGRARPLHPAAAPQTMCSRATQAPRMRRCSFALLALLALALFCGAASAARPLRPQR